LAEESVIGLAAGNIEIFAERLLLEKAVS